MNPITQAIADESVVIYEDGYARVWFGDFPLGGKIQTLGKRCKWKHDWYIDSYEGIRGTYTDKVCRKCARRKPLGCDNSKRNLINRRQAIDLPR